VEQVLETNAEWPYMLPASNLMRDPHVRAHLIARLPHSLLFGRQGDVRMTPEVMAAPLLTTTTSLHLHQRHHHSEGASFGAAVVEGFSANDVTSSFNNFQLGGAEDDDWRPTTQKEADVRVQASTATPSLLLPLLDQCQQQQQQQQQMVFHHHQHHAAPAHPVFPGGGDHIATSTATSMSYGLTNVSASLAERWMFS
jgi:hypothetical protein